ncbi:hypothetical protein BDZ85DRAFT_49871 [Elsinoe ampelina]|uniref:CFEM domain-containing protein n=1 Tax=Elsinoe ampelina TaxID=302913 RepID=A0A6A6GLI0_9PEZI|nr:hypothetical protein BDZ85DRAFT_49871 [Elsinoe ampelina]
MRFTTTAVVAVLTSQATATFWNLDAESYSSPSNRDNQCDDKQKGGYDFEDLNPDSDVGDYGGNKFSGFKCKKSPFTKRTFGLGKKTFGGSKCISGTVDSGSGPSFGGYSKGFSVSGMKLSVDYDTDVEAHFDMPDGKKCKQTISCKTSGTDYTNKQCGGATNVSFQLPKKSGGKKCGLNIHSIGFDCKSKEKDVPKKTPTSYKPSTADVPSTTPVVSSTTANDVTTSSVPVGTPTGYTPSQGTPTNTYVPIPSSPSSPASSTLSTVPVPSSAVPSSSYTSPASPPVGQYPSTSLPAPSSSTANAPSGPSTGVPVPYPSSSTPAAPGTPSSYVPSSSAPASSSTANAPSGPSTGVPVPYPSPSTPAASSGPSSYVPSSSAPATSTTANAPSTSPAVPSSTTTANAPSGSSSSVPAPYPSPSKPVGQYPSVPASSSTADAPTGPSSGPSYAPTSPAPAPSTPATPPAAGCPGIVPSCLNTWMWESGCSNNADASCYCKSKDFIEDVMDCIGSWGDDCTEQKKASDYLIGICADYVKDNSALVTAVPKCDASPEEPDTPETPGKTVTYKSTVEVTITSCAATVTNCPASSTIVTNSVITTSSVVVPSSPAQQVPTNTGAPTPSGSAPAPYPTTANAPSGPAPSVPVTTIPYTSVVTIPQTYTTGDQSGSPSAPVYSTISTTLTVPYVSFSTAPTGPGQTPSVGLYQPVPNPNATPTGKATTPVPGVPTGTGMYTTGRSPSATRPVSYTGAADKNAVGYVAVAMVFGAYFI